MVRYSAGIVTAYGAAKRAGYTGTYEDFCRQQAEYAESAAAVEQAKTTAVNAAATATTKAGEATTAATAAQTAKAQTEQAASQALTDISTARSGAISAVQTVGQTQTANARAQAQAAAQSATTASTKASEASASATSAGQSATNAAASATSAAQSASNAQNVLDSIPEDYSDLSANVSQLQADLGTLTPDVYKAFPTDTVSGGVAHFEDGADNLPLKSLVVNIEPVQGGSGDPSPTNIRPITGWTGVTVKRTGKNLVNMFSDGKIPSISNGQLVTGQGLRSDYISMDGDIQITFSGNTSSTIYCFFYDSGKNLISFNANTSPMSVTTPSNTAYVMLRTESSATSLQLELGSTATTYEPYNGTTFFVDWTSEAGTVYGGTLDVTTGVLTVTHGIVDLGTFTFSYSNVYNRFLSTRYLEASKKPATNNIAIDGCVCSAYKITSSNKTADSTYDKNLGISIDGRIDIRNTDYTEVDAFSESLDGVMFAYPLATPVTYQLTAQEVKTLLGANNIYADTGDVNVEYREDPTLYVDRKISDFAVMPMIAPTEAGYTATRNYTTGQLLIVDNTLYKVTANIANGGVITPNTNVVATTLSEVIASLS